MVKNNLYIMIIYKITNQINNKIYIGQTVQELKERWSSHKYNFKSNQNIFLYRAMRKYGIENFTIEEIGGANSQSELNYKEWLFIHNFNSLAPNGYNLRDGGRSNWSYSNMTLKKMSRSQKNRWKTEKNPRSKTVINIKTGEQWVSAKEALKQSDLKIAYTTFLDKLNGRHGNNTDFRYLGEEYKYKKWVGKAHGRGGRKNG